MPAMSTAIPHFGSCPVCEQGQVSPARCPDCGGWIAICDECEAIWSDPRAVRQSRPDGAHPVCPHCSQKVERWNFPNEKQLQRYGLEDLVAGWRTRN